MLYAPATNMYILKIKIGTQYTHHSGVQKKGTDVTKIFIF